MKRLINSSPIILLLLSFSFWASAQSAQQEIMLNKINKLRAEGCTCGGQFMAPAKELKWDKVLMTSAYRHAKDMRKKNYFSHYSPTGTDVGDRLDAAGYTWSFCGENLGSGQKNFDEVMEDWIKSPSHCRMLLNQEVEDVAVAQTGKYWVQHFGKRFDQKEYSEN